LAIKLPHDRRVSKHTASFAEKARRMPAGAECRPGGGTDFRVWAPERRTVRVVLEGGPGSPDLIELEPAQDGYHEGFAPKALAGTLYRFELDDDAVRYPDPVSRYQPEGPHGPSQVVDCDAFRWSDHSWRGVGREGHIIYEMHLGTFSRAGTWRGARKELAHLAALGITLIEVMPVNDFPGRFGWGYDGVGLFAPVALYGEPDDMRTFVNEAHALGVGVILDVVYNHFGPDGNYLRAFSPWYFHESRKNDWGESINFDGKNAGPVREFFTSNARYWIEEFHLDGLRLDATQEIHDESPRHIVADIARAARAAAGERGVYIVAENEPQRAILARPAEAGGYGLDALWNDDFHHAARVALTGRNEAYYSGYSGRPQEFISAAKYGYLYQGEWYEWQHQGRGIPALDLPPSSFVNFLQNHDQVANAPGGERPNKICHRGDYRAMTTLLMLLPGTPMLFQGQEFGATTPFHYFCDHKPEIAKLSREGRAKFLAQFPSLALPEMQALMPDPADPLTFEASKPDFSERGESRAAYRLHKELIALRRSDAVFSKPHRRGVDGAVLSAHAFALRYFSETHGDRLVLVNLGMDLHLEPCPEPLLAPMAGGPWRLLFSSEDPRYGGMGAPAPDTTQSWLIAGHSAVVLKCGVESA
jgi:maltooligosyltrehalose trehalohydrolase